MKRYLLVVKKYNNPYKTGKAEIMKAIVVDKSNLQKSIDNMHEYINDNKYMQLEIKPVENDNVVIKGGKCQ